MMASISASDLHTQENSLDEFRWKKRILLLLHETDSHSTYRQQLAALGKLDSEFEDRRLLVVDVQKDRYRIRNINGLDSKPDRWNTNESLYAKYALKKAGFSVVLIGLDGGIKISQTDVISKKELFERIDAMPMRQRELRTKH